MSRRTLSFIVGGLGVLIALASLIGLSVMGSVVADARTENIAGPGVDVFLRTPFPTPGSEIVLDVEARGGSQAGVEEVVVRDGEQMLADQRGRGVTWGDTIVDGQGRGADDETLRFEVPAGLAAGDTLHLTLDVGYVVAMSSGASSFENQSRHDRVPLDVHILSASGRLRARLLLAARALGLLALWMLVVWGVAYLFVTAKGGGDGQLEGIGVLMGLLGGGLLGYWLFARSLLAACEVTSTFWEVLLTALWLALPLWSVWRWWKRRTSGARAPENGKTRRPAA